MKLKKYIQAFLIIALIVTAAGCSGYRSDNSGIGDSKDIYPIKTNETIKYWVAIPEVLSGVVDNYGETEFAKEYMKRTGVNVEYIHPRIGEEIENLNVIIASNSLPDIIETDWIKKSPDSMIENSVIIKLNDLSGHMPYLNEYLKKNPIIDKQVKTDSGDYYCFPFIREDKMLLNTSGFMIRGDWLRELGLEIPETIDEWEIVLDALKTKCEYPLAFSLEMSKFFAGAFGIDTGYYVDNDGRVTSGIIEPEYKEYLTTMNRWYQKGFFGKNSSVFSLDQIRKNITDNLSAVDFSAGGSGMGYYISNKDKDGNDIAMEPVPFLAAEKGRKPEFGNPHFEFSIEGSAAITTHAKNPELCAAFLDYSYGPDGSMLNNFGIEGVSYEMIEGIPTYTDVITKNPDGLIMSKALPLYVRSSTAGPFVQDVRYIVQYYRTPSQIRALEVWGNNNGSAHAIPQITTTPDETRELAKINEKIDVYKKEMLVRFIMGDIPLDKFDETVEHCKSLGIMRAIEIYQNALDRFNSR